MRDLYAELISAAHSGAFGMNGLARPTPEQLKAGNYKKGKVNLHGMTIAIETPQGQRRMGKTDGEPWSVICMAHYGYIVGTKASDGDAIDVYVGPMPESEKVWVVNQNDKAGNFDEVKVLLGFHDEQSARSAYMNSYERGWQGLGSLIACSLDQFRWWLKFGDTTKPLTDRALPHSGNDDMNEPVWDSAANPVGCTAADLIYRLRGEDQDGLLLDAVTVNDILEDSDGEMTLDALVVQYNKVERKAEQLRRIMETAGGEVKPLSVQITPPFKQRGTTNVVIVYELSDGQTVSVWMHNPDSTPNRIKPDDELVSWAWRLNKKDVSIIVAPEKGQDLNPREVSRRIMRLAEKNSARFAKANAGRAERMASIEGMKSAVAEKEAQLATLDAEHEELTAQVTAKRNRVPATLQGTTQGADTDIEMNSQAAATLPPSTVRNQAVKAELAALGWDTAPGSTQVMVDIGGSKYSLINSVNELHGKLTSIDWNDSGWKYTDTLELPPAEFAANLDKAFRQSIADARAAVNFDPTTPEGYAQISDDQAALEANQDQLDSFFQGRLIAVRNALRELGWDGEKYKALSKNGYTLKQVLKQVGGGANIVGVHYEIAGVPGYFMSDDLSRSPQEIAEKINMGVPAAANTAAAEQARVITSAEDLRAGDYVEFNWGMGQGHSIAKITVDGGKSAIYVGGVESLVGKTTKVEYKPTTPNGPVGWWYLDAEDVASLKSRGMIPAENPQSLADLARSLIPAEFKSADFDGEGFNFVAADGLGIRLKSGPRGQVLGYVIDARGYDSLGARGSDPVQIKDLVDTALGVIEEKRGEQRILEIIGKDAVMIGKTRFESGTGGYYSTGRNSKPLTAAMLAEDGGSFELDDYALLRQAGNVTITSVGSENVYFTKGGVPYFTKLLNTDEYQEGQAADLSGVKEPAETAGESGELSQLVDGWMVKTPGDYPFGTFAVYDPDENFVGDFKADNPVKAVAAAKAARAQLPADAVSDDPEQAKYSKFNRSAIKMPTAVQLGMNTRGNPILITYKDQEGWSNGHILALHKPKVLTDAIAKYHVDDSKLRRLSDDAVSRVVPRDATLKIEPIALYESIEKGSKSTVSELQRKDEIKVKAVVLSNESAGVAVPVDARYFGYFDKQFKQPDYFVSRDGSGAVVVKKAGEVVGVIMPIKGTDGMLKRAAKAAGTADQVGEAAQAPESFRHEGFNIYPFGNGRWAVQTAENLQREQAGERQIGGDTIVDTQEQAKAQAEIQTAQAADKDSRDALNAEQAAAELAAAQAKASDLADIGEVAGETPMQRGRRLAALSTMIRHDGVVKTKKKMIEDLVAAGAQTSTYEENRIKEMSRTAFNRATQAEQDAHARKVAQGGKVTGYLLGESVVDKTGYDYANYLIAKNDQVQPTTDFAAWEEAFYSAIEEQGDMSRSDAQGVAEAQGDMMNEQFAAGVSPEAAAAAVLAAGSVGGDYQAGEAKAFLNDVIAGNVDYMDETLADRLESVATQYAADAEVQALFEQAANAYSAYMIEQARAAMA